jgi:hypothetical protein
MFGIKLIGPKHLEIPAFTQVFDGSDGRWPLMNFNMGGQNYVADIPTGHRCLVYVTSPWKRFLWAIELTGSLANGDLAFAAHGYEVGKDAWGENGKATLHRPIGLLARIDSPQHPAGPNDVQGPTYDEVHRRSGVPLNRLRSFGSGHWFLSRAEYESAFAAIDWGWSCDPGLVAQPHTPPAFIDPPVPDAEDLLRRVQEVRGLQEHNMEGVTSIFLERLGHTSASIVRQDGYVDLRIATPEGGTKAVVEVKKSLTSRKILAEASEQAFRYALRKEAPIVVVTDADVYHVWDRTRGLGLETSFCGKFQLTRFQQEDEKILDLLRP